MFRLALILALMFPAAALAQVGPCGTPERGAFDFWIGRWTLRDAETGASVGVSHIQRLWGGCAILEDFTADDGFTGGSLVQWDPVAALWRLTGGGSTGAAMVLEGRAEGAKVVLTTQVRTARGEPRTIRMVLEPTADGGVRQTSDVSSDGGATWRPRYAYLYRRRD